MMTLYAPARWDRLDGGALRRILTCERWCDDTRRYISRPLFVERVARDRFWLMMKFVHRHLLLPAFETGVKRRKSLRYWRELERTQWLSRAEVERLQFEALSRLIQHAFENCP